LFRIMREIALAQDDPATAPTAARIAFMIDQSHNVEGKIDAMAQSAMNVQTAYAKALCVDEAAVAAAQRGGGGLGGHRLGVARVRAEAGVEPDPVAAFRAGGHAERLARERGSVAAESAYG